MKICVSSQGDGLSSPVDSRFGRAEYFVVVDTETMEFEAIKNDNVNVAGGAGVGSAKLVTDSGAKAVLTGNCGPKADMALRAGGVEIYTGLAGTVSEAVEKFKAGQLTTSQGPSVGEHSGM